MFTDLYVYSVLKVLCVSFTGIYWQNMADQKYNIHKYVFISVVVPRLFLPPLRRGKKYLEIDKTCFTISDFPIYNAKQMTDFNLDQ